LTTPHKAGCRKSVPVVTSNNTEAKTLTADVDAASASEPTVLAAGAAGSGSQGDYKVTSLSASATLADVDRDFRSRVPRRLPSQPHRPYEDRAVALDPDLRVAVRSGVFATGAGDDRLFAVVNDRVDGLGALRTRPVS
jgi:hypothetical protein